MARLRMGAPCSARGGEFEDRGGETFCRSCQKVVHDLRRASRAEAAALFRAQGGELCARVRAWPDGELRWRAEAPRGGLLAAAAGAAIALSSAGCAAPTETEPDEMTAAEAARAQAALAEEAARERERARAVNEPPNAAQRAAELRAQAEAEAAARRAIDHGDDASPNREDHADHSHRHEPVLVDDEDDHGLVGGLTGL